MVRPEAGIARFLAILVMGYGIAIAIAVPVTVGLYLLPTVLPDEGRWGSFYREIGNLAGYLLIGASHTVMFAWPGYGVTLYLARGSENQGPRFYAIGGVLTAVFAHLLLAGVSGGGFFRAGDVYIVLCSLPGGAAGGVAFWYWRRFIVSRFA